VGRLHTGVGLRGTPMHLFKAYAHPYFGDFKINKNEEILRNFNQNYLIPKLFSLFLPQKSLKTIQLCKQNLSVECN